MWNTFSNSIPYASAFEIAIRGFLVYSKKIVASNLVQIYLCYCNISYICFVVLRLVLNNMLNIHTTSERESVIIENICPVFKNPKQFLDHLL